MTDEQIIKALECCCDIIGNRCSECPSYLQKKDNDFCQEDLHNFALDLINRQKAEKERLEIELQAMRNAANSYKSKTKTLEMDKAQLHSDIVNANQNFDHIKGLWEAEKEKVEKAKQKVINVCKELQTAKAEIERLKGWQDLLKAEKHSLIKSEAIKEFAERLKEGEVYMRIGFPNTKNGTETYVVLSDDIDNLVKEMTEGSK